MQDAQQQRRRLGFAVKVLGDGGLPSHDTRRWQSGPNINVSIDALYKILDYVRGRSIRMYRMSSDFVPYATHPEMPQFHHQIEASSARLSEVGRRAIELDVRLSVHPSQYVVLNAQDDTIAKKAIWDLSSQARLLDALQQGPEAVVVLHVGGIYGDKRAAIGRFLENYELLDEAAKRRLVIENDETHYTVQDCLFIHRRTGLRIVFDHQHHRLNPGDMTATDAARAALATWPASVVPKIHFSSPRLDGREIKRGKVVSLSAPLLRQHADYVDPWTFGEFLDALRGDRFDVMLEAKAKDLALLKLEQDLEKLGFGHVLWQPSPQ